MPLLINPQTVKKKEKFRRLVLWLIPQKEVSMRVNMPFANVYPCEDAKVPLIKSSNFIYSVKALYLKILLPFFSLTTGANKTTIKNTCMHMHMCKHIYIIKIKKKGDYGGVRGTRGHTLQVHQMKTPVTSS